VPPERIFSNAVGADDFIADNASDRGRALNRRVEVLLMKDGVPLAFEFPARATR
jgi:flagellar motor protein MotB